MKKEIKDKFTEIGSFFACIVVLLAIAYFTGFIKGFSPENFQEAYSRTVAGLTDSAAKNSKADLFNVNSSKSRRISKYKDYQPMFIPQAVLRGVESSGMWKQVFYSDKKVVFYIYNDTQADFHNLVQNYLATRTKAKHYNLYAYNEAAYSSMRVGDIGPSKICDSLAECNAVRQKAADYTALTEFLKICGRYMCIINPTGGQYVRLRSKNSGQAVKMINDLVNW